MDVNLISLKIDLAKAEGLNEALQDELESVKRQHRNEVQLLEETIEVQQQGL